MRLVHKLLFLAIFLTLANYTQGQEISKHNILSTIGTAAKWNSVNNNLFTSSNPTALFKEHSFLIDKSTGRSRFEGKTNTNQNIVLLFNYKSKTVDKSYSNGKLVENKTTVPQQEIIDLLFEDTKLLFLPMLIISSSSNNITVHTGKIVNTEKLVELRFKNIYNLNKQPLNGSIYLNSKGEIKEYHLEQQIFQVSESKDIGDGIFLSTLFSSKNSDHRNIKFNTVAAFTDIENDKLTTF